MKRSLEFSTVILGYLLIAVVMTYPLVFNLNQIPHSGVNRIAPGTDVLIVHWLLWWFKFSLFKGLPLFETDFLFYPSDPVSLYFAFLPILNSFFSVPLQYFFNLTVSTNLLFLLALILSGFGTYLLVKYLTHSRAAAFFSGCLFAFSPFIFVHLNHLTIYSAYQWVPFFILFLIRTYKEKSFLNPIWAALFYSAMTLSDLNYTTGGAAFILFFLTAGLIWERNRILNRSFLCRFLFFCVAFFVILLPYVVPLVSIFFSENVRVSFPIESSISQSLDFLSFFLPSFLHPIFGPFVEPIYHSMSFFDGLKVSGYNELTGYIGFLPLLFIFMAFKMAARNKTKPWFFITAIFLVLSMGPALKINGLVTIPTGDLGLAEIAQKIEPDLDPLAIQMLKKYIGIPLPYFLWHYIPILSGSESAARLFAFAAIGLAVLSGFGYNALWRKFEPINQSRHQLKRYLFFMIPLFLLLFEYASFPLPIFNLDTPPFYKQLKNEPGDFAVLDIPMFVKLDKKDAHYHRVSQNPVSKYLNMNTALAMHYQTIHEKKIMTGHLARFPNNFKNFVEKTPFIRQLLEPEHMDYTDTNIPAALFRSHAIKYIVIHKSKLTRENVENIKKFIRLKIPKVHFEDSATLVYKTY